MTPQELQEIITKRGWTQADTAEAIGVDPRTVRRWLAGDTEINKRTATLLRLMGDV